MRTFSIIIPARNEAENIGNLLDDVQAQQLDDQFALEKIIVVSDCSSDETESIVRTRSTENTKLELIVNRGREGKLRSIGTGMRNLTDDCLVLLDADIRLAGRSTLRNLLKALGPGVGLAAGSIVPSGKGHGSTALIAMCSDMMVGSIQRRLRGGSNIFSARGPIMALSRDFYSTLLLPTELEAQAIKLDAEYMYLSCIEENMKYVYALDAEVLHSSPASFMEYLRGSIRFFTERGNPSDRLGEIDVAEEWRIPFKVKVMAFLELCHKEPLGALAWSGYRIVVYVLLAARRLGLAEGIITESGVPESTRKWVN